MASATFEKMFAAARARDVARMQLSYCLLPVLYAGPSEVMATHLARITRDVLVAGAEFYEAVDVIARRDGMRRRCPICGELSCEGLQAHAGQFILIKPKQ